MMLLDPSIGELSPAQAELMRALLYDPHTGDWWWRKAPSNTIADWQRAGSIDKNGYLIIRWKYKGLKAHRLAVLYMTGVMPILDVDHKNGNRADCRWVNLRQATRRKNSCNMVANTRNKLQVKGVQERKYGRFRARIRHFGKLKNLGSYATLEEAQAAYQAAAERLQGEFAVHRREA